MVFPHLKLIVVIVTKDLLTFSPCINTKHISNWSEKTDKIVFLKHRLSIILRLITGHFYKKPF